MRQNDYAVLYVDTAFRIDRMSLRKIVQRLRQENIPYKTIDINWKFPFYDTDVPLGAYFAMDFADIKSNSVPSTPLLLAKERLLEGEDEILSNINYLKRLFLIE